MLLLRLLVLVVAVALAAADLLVFLHLCLSSEVSSCAGIAESPSGSPKEPIPSMMVGDPYPKRKQGTLDLLTIIATGSVPGWEMGGRGRIFVVGGPSRHDSKIEKIGHHGVHSPDSGLVVSQGY